MGPRRGVPRPLRVLWRRSGKPANIRRRNPALNRTHRLRRVPARFRPHGGHGNCNHLRPSPGRLNESRPRTQRLHHSRRSQTAVRNRGLSPGKWGLSLNRARRRHGKSPVFYSLHRRSCAKRRHDISIPDNAASRICGAGRERGAPPGAVRCRPRKAGAAFVGGQGPWRSGREMRRTVRRL